MRAVMRGFLSVAMLVEELKIVGVGLAAVNARQPVVDLLHVLHG